MAKHKTNFLVFLQKGINARLRTSIENFGFQIILFCKFKKELKPENIKLTLDGSDASNTYCPECKKLLVERKGYFITKNNISDNKCPYCSEKIAGLWK